MATMEAAALVIDRKLIQDCCHLERAAELVIEGTFLQSPQL
jgi:hypothetical protein